MILNLQTIALSNDKDSEELNSASQYLLNDAFKDVKNAVNNAGGADQVKGCATCAINNLPKTPPKTNLYSADNNKTVELSVLTEAEATTAFNFLQSQPDIPYGFPLDGCYARAHKMSRLLEDKGIISGKAFIEGSLHVDTKDFGEITWSYHVAPVIMVKPAGQKIAIPYVIDPSLFSKPVPYATWKAIMTKSQNSSIDHEYFTNRYAYDPNDRTADYKTYTDESVSDMNDTNKKFKDMLAQYKANQTK